jgi:16S rRNA (guanine527-N7)-methyltransferase
MPVAERIRELVIEHGLDEASTGQFQRLLEALAAEPDPHTTVSDPADAVDQHVADSLSALGVEGLRGAGRVGDIGAGAGFPGLPLAIALPGAQFDLVESTQRKCAVIGRLSAAAGIANARTVPARAEAWAASEGARVYNGATARAVAPLAVLVEYAAPLLTLGGTFVAWKGARNEDEEGSGREAAEIVGLRPVDVIKVTPFAGARDLNLHVYLKDRPAPDRFPRRTGAAAKRPLA